MIVEINRLNFEHYRIKFLTARNPVSYQLQKAESKTKLHNKLNTKILNKRRRLLQLQFQVTNNK